MNILFYIEPIIERENPYWKKNWLDDICFNIINTLKQSSNDYHFEIIINEAIAQTINFENKNVNIHIFTQEELLKPFGTDYMHATESWHMNTYSEEQLSYYENLMKTKLDEYVPDIIITFTPVPFFKQLFKNTLILHHEFGIFSRLPFPSSYFFDPIGVSSYSYYNQFKKEIENISLDTKQKEQIKNFKLLCQNILIEKSPFKAILEKERTKFKSLILLPLQFSKYYLFDNLVSFKSQYEYCVYVLDNTPKSIGVVVNMHPEHHVLSQEAIRFLKSKYSNFIYVEDFNTIYASAQFILPFVDAVISVSSSIALQTLLFDKKVILLGKSCFEYIADGFSLKNLENTLNSELKNKDTFLYHMLTRYAVTNEYLHNPIWLNNFLSTSLTRFRENKVDINFYDLIDNKDKLFNTLSSNLTTNSNLVPQYINKNDIQLFFDFGKGIDDKTFFTKVVNNDNTQTFTFDLNNLSSFYSLRLDPLNDKCIIDLESCILITDFEEIDITKDVYSNACYVKQKRYFFESNDPQIFFMLKNIQKINNAKKVIVKIIYLHKGEEALFHILKNSNSILDEQKNQILILEDSLKNSNSILDEQKNQILILEDSLKNNNSILDEQKNQILILEDSLKNIENQYFEILNSKSMRITAPLRKITSFIKRKEMLKINLYKHKFKNFIFNQKIKNKIKKIEFFSKKYIKPTIPFLHDFIFEKIKRNVKHLMITNLVSVKKIDGLDFKELLLDDKNKNIQKEPLVSIIVPNYNHEPYLRERLESIYGQSYRNFEVILLDDVSSDNSITILEEYANKYPEISRLIINENNSGGVFHQWKKGIDCAKGDLIWIAESDDSCSLDLIEKLIPFFDNEGVMLAYARTVFIKDQKEIWTINEYLNDIDSEIWNKEFLSCSHTLVNKAWGIKNILPNASSAIFRNPKGLKILSDPLWQKMRICGDWIFYLHIIRGGLVGYTPNTTNYYRIHDSNTSVATYAKEIYYQEHEYVAETLCNLYKIDENLLEKQEISLKEHWNNYMLDKNEDDFLKLYNIEKIKNHINNRKPNIMMVTFALVAGGGETLPIKMANMLSNIGYGVTMVSLEQEKENLATRSMLLPHIPLIKINHLERIEAIATGLGIEIIHSHHAWADLTLVSLLQKNSEIALIISTHGMYEMMNDQEFEDNFNLLKTRVDKIVYTAQKNLVPFLKMKDIDNLMVKIGNALEPYEINPICREKLKIEKDAFVLCLVSRAIPQKGWEEAIQSVKRAREICNKNIELILIGEGAEYFRLKEIVTESFIHFYGFQSNIRDYFAMSDLGFLPSRFEGESFPLVIIDCLYAGKPVLSSNIGDIYNMLHEENQCAGAVFDLEDMTIPIETVATLITKFVTDKEFYQKSLEAIDKVIVKYDPKNMIEKYDDIYNEVCKKRIL